MLQHYPAEVLFILVDQPTQQMDEIFSNLSTRLISQVKHKYI